MRTILLLLALCGLLVSCQTSAPDGPAPLKVGIVLPLTGGQATFGAMQKNGYDMAAERINREGGLFGRPLELIFEDDQDKADKAKSAVEKLITQDGVDVVMGSFTSPTTYAACEVVERYGVPFIVPCAATDKLTQQGYKWTFRMNAPSSAYARTMLEFIQAQLKCKTIAVVYETSGFGSSTAEEIRRMAPEFGLELVGDEEYEKGTADFKPLLNRLKSRPPDIIYMVAYQTDAILLMRQAQEVDLNPKVYAGGGAGFTLQEFIDGAQLRAELVLTATQWVPEAPWPGAKEYAGAYQRRYGIEPEYHSAETYAALYVLADALKLTRGNSQREALRDALDRLETTGIFGPIAFRDSGRYTNQNEHQMVVLQIQNGRFVPVYPAEFKREDARLPVPTWSERFGGSGRSDTGRVLPQVILDGLLTGALYSLVGIGLTLVFGVMRIINFAHGELVMLGMYGGFTLFRYAGIDPFLAILLLAPLLFLFGALLQHGLIRRVLEAPQENQILLTVGVGLVLSNVVMLAYSPNYQSVTTSYTMSIVSIGGMTLSVPRLLAFGVTSVLTGLLYWFLTRTPTGLALRALGQDPVAARLMGINADRMSMFTFGLGTVLAGIAGILLSPVYPNISPVAGAPFQLKAFVVVVLGGLGSVVGALWGGMLLGVLEALGATFISNSMKDVFAFLIFLVILLFRPGGLMGKARL